VLFRISVLYCLTERKDNEMEFCVRKYQTVTHVAFRKKGYYFGFDKNRTLKQKALQGKDFGFEPSTITTAARREGFMPKNSRREGFMPKNFICMW
jgi:hypothetical protein